MGVGADIMEHLLCASENESTATKESSVDSNDVEFGKENVQKKKCNPVAKRKLRT